MDGGNDLDEIDVVILTRLQEDGRLSNAELAREVGLSPPAVAQRVKRLEERGAIQGFHARVDPAALGYPLRAIVRLRPHHEADFAEFCVKDPQVLASHRVTGEDCYVADVIAPSMASLEALLDRAAAYGTVVTSVVLSTAIDHRVIEPPQV